MNQQVVAVKLFVVCLGVQSCGAESAISDGHLRQSWLLARSL